MYLNLKFLFYKKNDENKIATFLLVIFIIMMIVALVLVIINFNVVETPVFIICFLIIFILLLSNAFVFKFIQNKKQCNYLHLISNIIYEDFEKYLYLKEYEYIDSKISKKIKNETEKFNATFSKTLELNKLKPEEYVFDLVLFLQNITVFNINTNKYLFINFIKNMIKVKELLKNQK
ncbi:MAG: hypothetical protein LBH55_03995 [Mycoplasmataceae bacterium]|jgi:hypothetical protein|nr:hypothetical protein [Mycoplasmataceae bacterium]